MARKTWNIIEGIDMRRLQDEQIEQLHRVRAAGGFRLVCPCGCLYREHQFSTNYVADNAPGFVLGRVSNISMSSKEYYGELKPGMWDGDMTVTVMSGWERFLNFSQDLLIGQRGVVVHGWSADHRIQSVYDVEEPVAVVFRAKPMMSKRRLSAIHHAVTNGTHRSCCFTKSVVRVITSAQYLRNGW